MAMSGVDGGSNRHPVDRLGITREAQRRLAAHEKDLKAEVSELMDDHDSLAGDEYIARQSLQTRAGALDIESLAHDLGISVEKLNALYRKPDITSYVIRLKPIEGDDD